LKSFLGGIILSLAVLLSQSKLQIRIIEKCRKIAKIQGVDLRHRYLKIVKECLINQRFRQHPKNRKKAFSSARKIKTIAWRLVRELERKLP
jgi:transposase, IS5 family